MSEFQGWILVLLVFLLYVTHLAMDVFVIMRDRRLNKTLNDREERDRKASKYWKDLSEIVVYLGNKDIEKNK